jgi:hypothetical protein
MPPQQQAPGAGATKPLLDPYKQMQAQYTLMAILEDGVNIQKRDTVSSRPMKQGKLS